MEVKAAGQKTQGSRTCLTDLYDTLREITGQTQNRSGGRGFLQPHGPCYLRVKNRRQETTRSTLISHSISGSLLISGKGDWKLCLSAGSGGWSAPKESECQASRGLPPIQLFNLKQDRGETRNLPDQVAKNKGKVKVLTWPARHKEVKNGRCSPSVNQCPMTGTGIFPYPPGLISSRSELILKHVIMKVSIIATLLSAVSILHLPCSRRLGKLNSQELAGKRIFSPAMESLSNSTWFRLNPKAKTWSLSKPSSRNSKR